MVARTGLFVAPAPGTPPVGASPTDARLALAALTGATPQLAQGGAITQSATTMQCTLAASVFLLPDITNAAAAFLSPIDPTTLTPAQGPSTGSRIDSIAVKQNNYENSDTDSRANAILVAGTASGTPIHPTLPAGYFRYADITVPTNAANAAACTVTILSPTTFAPLWLNAPTWALLQTVTGQPGQHARVTADPASSNNRDYFWDSAAAQWRPQYAWYREYTLGRSGVTDGTTFFLVATETAANATANSFGVTNTSATNGLLVLEPGVYVISSAVHMGGVTTGTSFAQVRNFTSGGPIIARGPVALPADPYAQASGLFRANGTDAVIIEAQKSTGGTTTLSGALRITKLGPL